jgi:hypothetical protein
MVSSHAATEAATAAPPCIACTPTQRAKPRGPSMCFSDRLPRNFATMLHSIRHGRPFKPAEWSTRRLKPPDGALLALAQSNRTRPIRCAKPLEPKSPRVSGMGLDFAETVRPRTAPPGSLHF